VKRAAVLPLFALAACIPSVDRPPREAAPQRPQRTPLRMVQAIPPEQPVMRDGSDVAALPAPRPAWEARPVSADAQRIDESV
jgi:lipoprotein NlpD